MQANARTSRYTLGTNFFKIGDVHEEEMTTERETKRRALILGAVLTLIIGAIFLSIDLTDDPTAPRPQTARFPLPIPWTVFASILLGMGLGTQIALLWGNWGRLRPMLAPTRTRILCALFLIMLVPVRQFWAIPIVNGLFWYGLIAEMFSQGRVWAEFKQYPLFTAFFFFGYPALLYLASCLTLSGVRKQGMRVAIFGQIWLACYGATLLLGGFYSGNM